MHPLIKDARILNDFGKLGNKPVWRDRADIPNMAGAKLFVQVKGHGDPIRATVAKDKDGCHYVSFHPSDLPPFLVKTPPRFADITGWYARVA